MKKIIFILLMSAALLTSFSCNTTSRGSSMSGKIENAENMKISVEKVYFSPDIDPNVVVGKGDADASGNFNFDLEGLEPGFYIVKIGQKNMMFVLNGDEKNINFTGNLADISKFSIKIDGAPAATEFITTMNEIVGNKLNLEQVKTRIDKTKYPIVAMGITINAFRNNPQFLDIHKKVLDRFKTSHPDSKYTSLYSKFVNEIANPPAAPVDAAKGNKPVQTGPIAVGKQAPDISLPDVNGKIIKLSDLKGKLVLLDFWASWCGPCRRENPNVVRIYEKYKAQGFTVYSVSLDGIDGRTEARLKKSGQSIDDYIAKQKKRWLDAIAQDKLVWKNHVSDLKKWDCAPAKDYGVRGIPKSFLIGKDGKIAEIGLRGAAALEEAIKKHI